MSLDDVILRYSVDLPPAHHPVFGDRGAKPVGRWRGRIHYRGHRSDLEAVCYYLEMEAARVVYSGRPEARAVARKAWLKAARKARALMRLAHPAMYRCDCADCQAWKAQPSSD